MNFLNFMELKPRAGSKIYKGCEIPITARIILDNKGRECYLSAICGNDATIRYIDNGSYLIVPYERLKEKL